MRATVIRTAYSSIYEAKDFSCALFDADARWSPSRRTSAPHRADAVVGAVGDGGVRRRPPPRRRLPAQRPLPRRHAPERRHHASIRSSTAAAARVSRPCARTGRTSAAWCPGSLSGARPRSTRKACASRRSRSSSGAGSTRRRSTCPQQHARARRAPRRLPCRASAPAGSAERASASWSRATGLDVLRTACALNLDRAERACGRHRRACPTASTYYEDYLETFPRRRVRAAAAAADADHRRRPHDRRLHRRRRRRCRCRSTRRSR